MTSELKTTVRARVTDPKTVGLVVETVLEPLAGQGAFVSPPTYAREEGDKSKAPRHAFSAEAFVPERSDSGWYSRFQRTPEGAPRLAGRVLLDSVGSQSGRAETCLWEQQQRLGVALPGIVVGGEGAPGTAAVDEPDSVLDRQLADALATEVSTWQAAHRQSDAWIRFAEVDAETGEQLWQQDEPDSLKAKLTAASAQNAKLLYEYFVNSAIYGFWLSSGTAARHRLPRAYSSEIVGYGAHAVETAATKLDPAGGASKDSKVAIDASGELRLGGRGGKEPSKLGLGQVPSPAVVRGYVCELILQQASLSLSVLRSLRFETPEQRDAALTVLSLLAMAGHVLAREDGFLRSGCALVAVEERWGWKRQYGGSEPETFEAPTLEDLSAALGEAVSDAEQVGLRFAAPVRLRFSRAQRDLIAERVRIEGSKAAEPEPS